jgi:hypothetical protein
MPDYFLMNVGFTFICRCAPNRRAHRIVVEIFVLLKRAVRREPASPRDVSHLFVAPLQTAGETGIVVGNVVRLVWEAPDR